MITTSYIKPERVYLRTHPELTERWVQDLISRDTQILGLGDLVLLQQERIQPSGGRLDLLLQDPDTKRRYEAELQLGATDESHIIRTIEYWDIERKRYPQYDHCAVLVAEEITSRFLNVVALFHGSIPLIALQMQAYKVGEHLTLIFTRVLDELSRGFVGEDEAAEAAPTDRAYWERKASRATVEIADQILIMVKDFDQGLELKYNKFYIGFAKNSRANNFVTFIPRKNTFVLQPKCPQSEELDTKMASEGLEVMGYDKQWGNYNIRIGKQDTSQHGEFLKELLHSAFELRNG
jgi:predicted transport protein